tara:strand:+ start:308 stop:1621 length:1314 start_codon:yes stop_codon:yes gene_type:complete
MMCGILGLFLVVLVSGCGDPNSKLTELQVVDLEMVDPTGQEVVYWYQHTREREKELQEMIKQFNKSNPYDISVKGEFAGSYKDIYNKMVVGIQTDVLPNITVAYQNQATAYYRDGGIVDITSYMTSPKWGLKPDERADYVESFLSQDLIDGIQTGFPPNRSIEVLYYNADWMKELGYDQPPRTWDEFAFLCSVAKKQPFSRNSGKKRSLGFLIEADASRLASMVFSRGGNLADLENKLYTFDTIEMRLSLSWLRKWTFDGSVELLSEKYGDQAEFAAGQVLFMLGSSSGIPFVDSAVRDGYDFKWSVTHLPHTTPSPTVNVYGASISLCKASQSEELASWLFVKWLTQPEQQARWVRASNYFPVRRSTAERLTDYFRENPQYKSAYSLLEFGRSEPTISSYQQVRKKMQEIIIDVTDGVNIEHAVNELQSYAEELNN